MELVATRTCWYHMRIPLCLSFATDVSPSRVEILAVAICRLNQKAQLLVSPVGSIGNELKRAVTGLGWLEPRAN